MDCFVQQIVQKPKDIYNNIKQRKAENRYI